MKFEIREIWILFLFLFSSAITAQTKDTVIVTFNPTDCRNCIVQFPYFDSCLRANDFTVKYCLYGLRPIEIKPFLSRQLSFIKPENVILKTSFLDSIFRSTGSNFFFKGLKRSFSCDEFGDWLLSYCPVVIDEDSLQISRTGRFYYVNDGLLYVDGDHQQRIGLINSVNGKLIKEISPFTDSTIYECYKNVWGNKVEKAWQGRQLMLESGYFNNYPEFELGEISSTFNKVRILCTLKIFNPKEGIPRPYPIVLGFNNQFQVTELLVAKSYHFDGTFIFLMPGYEFDFISDSEFIASIGQNIYANQKEKLNVLGLFGIVNNEIIYKKSVAINCRLLNTIPKDFGFIYPFQSITVNGNLYYYSFIVPFLYLTETNSTKEFPLYSNSNFSNFNYLPDSFLGSKKFCILHTKFHQDTLYEVFIDNYNWSEFHLATFDKNLKFIYSKKLHFGQLKTEDSIRFIDSDGTFVSFIKINDRITTFSKVPLHY